MPTINASIFGHQPNASACCVALRVHDKGHPSQTVASFGPTSWVVSSHPFGVAAGAAASVYFGGAFAVVNCALNDFMNWSKLFFICANLPSISALSFSMVWFSLASTSAIFSSMFAA